jgi:hypothetical protein
MVYRARIISIFSIALMILRISRSRSALDIADHYEPTHETRLATDSHQRLAAADFIVDHYQYRGRPRRRLVTPRDIREPTMPLESRSSLRIFEPQLSQTHFAPCAAASHDDAQPYGRQ